MEKVLITGGLGFIGFHLSQRLILEGIEVIVIDQMPANKKDIQEEMMMRLGRNALLTIIDEKLEKAPLKKYMAQVDAVFHLAASTSEDSKWSNLQHVIEANVNLTKTMIAAMPKGARLIYPSTIEVYGERTGEVTERAPTNPISPYGITKLAGEQVIKKECTEKGISYVILRLPTVYGPWQREDMTYQQMITGVTKPTIDRSTVDVLYVEDAVDAFLLAGRTDKANEIFHLSSQVEDAWYKGVQLLEAGRLDKDEQKKLKMSLSPEKSQHILGFSAKTSLKEGLARQKEHVGKLKKRWY